MDRRFWHCYPNSNITPLIDIGEFPIDDAPVNHGTVLDVPLPVTLCAAALIALKTSANPKKLFFHMHSCNVLTAVLPDAVAWKAKLIRLKRE